MESLQAALAAAQQHEAYKAFEGWADETSEQILTWAHPELPAAQRATAGWPMTDFKEMFAWVVVYAIIVFVGMVLYKKPKRSPKRDPPTWSEVWAGFVAEPVKFLQLAYNFVQVGLARNLNIHLPRNPHLCTARHAPSARFAGCPVCIHGCGCCEGV